MPAPAGTKRVKGVSIYRPFVYGSIAHPIDPNKREDNLPAEHTHRWTIFVRGVDGEDISYWLKKVQFKLHETYANSLRTIDSPPFEVSETGWGEFEVQIKLHFVSESMEKSQNLWHNLKLHPYGPDAEKQKEERTAVISQNYEEIIFNEPVEQFYEILTGGPQQTGRGKGKGKMKIEQNTRTADIPYRNTSNNQYSQETEAKELDRLNQAIKTVDRMLKEERKQLGDREKDLDKLREAEGLPPRRPDKR